MPAPTRLSMLPMPDCGITDCDTRAVPPKVPQPGGCRMLVRQPNVSDKHPTPQSLISVLPEQDPIPAKAFALSTGSARALTPIVIAPVLVRTLIAELVVAPFPSAS